jgi:hypothetical protein
MEARNKLSAEASLEEEKIILGWCINFSTSSSPSQTTSSQLGQTLSRKILSRGTSTAKELETMIGQLGQLSAIIPFVYQFLIRFRDLQQKAMKRRSIAISQPCWDDLELMTLFLEKEAFMGVNMNLISFRHPTHIYRSNSCPFGLGGYSREGFAWRLELQGHHRFRASNNLLKFIASLITPWIDMMANHLQPGDCVLSITDRTTSAGWLKRTNFSEEAIDPIKATIHLEIARKHTSLFIHHNIKEYLKRFPGKKINVADALSLEN